VCLFSDFTNPGNNKLLLQSSSELARLVAGVCVCVYIHYISVLTQTHTHTHTHTHTRVSAYVNVLNN